MSTTHPSIESVVDQVSQLLLREVGLRPEPPLRGRLRRCIRDDAMAQGQDLDSYVATLHAGSDALQSLLNRITVQETAFFRHAEHFEVLGRDILPGLRRPVTIWSAACANGQEAFTLAMLLDEQRIDGSVIATDLSTAAVQRTQAARYAPRELSGLSAERRARYLTRHGDEWQINQSLRDRVTIFRHNLLDPIPNQARTCQVIFCRNVLIYFSPEHARTFLDLVADTLPASWLFLGAAETMWQVSDRFDAVRLGGTFAYRQRTAKTRPSAHPPQDAKPSTRGPRRVRFPSPLAAAPETKRPAPEDDVAVTIRLTRAGQQASAAGDSPSAVVAFRKCAYLAPHDPMTHLHLGLALESAGDRPSAQRAYAAARHALTASDPAQTEDATEGYTMADLIRLLDFKQQAGTP